MNTLTSTTITAKALDLFFNVITFAAEAENRVVGDERPACMEMILSKSCSQAIQTITRPLMRPRKCNITMHKQNQ